MECCLERRLCGIALYILSFPNASLVMQKKKKKKEVAILFGCARKEITLVHLAGAGTNCGGVDPQHRMKHFLIHVVCSDVDSAQS